MKRLTKASCATRRTSAGLSMIEILVGIVVGMLAIVIVMQVLKVSEGARRTTTGGADAQTTGAIALSLLQQDIQQAGNGFMDQNTLGCNVTIDNGRVINNIGHVTINHPNIPAGDAGSETLLIVFGDPSGMHLGNRITGQPTANQYAVEAPQGFRLGEQVIAAPEFRTDPCNLAMASVTNSPATSATPVGVSAGLASASRGFLFNMGMNPVVRAYAVRAGQLTTCSFRTHDCTSTSAAAWQPMAESIVAMRALYERDTSAPPDDVPDVMDATTPTTAQGWRDVRGIRLVVVARSGQLEKEDVTDVAGGEAAPTWSAAASAAISVPGSNWKRFRYRTFEATVALPNVPAYLPNGFWPPA